MAYRLLSLLSLLAVCASAATSAAEFESEAMDISGKTGPGLVRESAVSDVTNTPTIVTAAASSAPAAPLSGPPVISHAQANSVIQAAVKKAVEIKSPSNIAVTDPYGHLVSFLRMDGAVLASIDVAIKKAKTVSMFGGQFRSGDLYNATGPSGPLFGKCHYAQLFASPFTLHLCMLMS
jgi:uncharacterized protein GlcG (DUF336 family)